MLLWKFCEEDRSSVGSRVWMVASFQSGWTRKAKTPPRFAARLLIRPLDGTAHRGGFLHAYGCHGLAGEHRVDGQARILPLGEGLSRTRIHAALVAQLALLVEHKHVRRGRRTISARDRLRLAVV